MTAPTDPAIEVIDAFTTAMKQAFRPDDAVFPPVGGGSDTVRFFAGDGPALAAFDFHSTGTKCKTPFLWVRLGRRYHFRPGAFPAPIVDTAARCADAAKAVQVEVGVGRCSVAAKERPTWDEYAAEGEISLDDSWRIGLALCMAADALRTPKRNVGINTVDPYGPEGGIIAWVGSAYVQL